MALPKKNRIIRKKDYKRVFKEGKTVKNSFFFIKYLPNLLGYSRWGAIVTLKISKKSVKRNRIKRIITEIVRKNYLSKISCDIIITPLPIILDKSFNEIKSILEKDINQILSQPTHSCMNVRVNKKKR